MRTHSKDASARVLRLTYSALYLAIALVLPFLTGQIPQIGSMLCPMHIPALLWTARLRTAAMSWYVTPPGANGLLLFLNAAENYA